MIKPSPHVASPHFLPAYPARTVIAILLASVCYLSVLSFINARGLNVSPAIIGFYEFLIYIACLTVIRRQLTLATVALSVCVCAWIVFTWVIRQSPDLKSLRDLIVPLLFLSLGRLVADAGFADRCLKVILGVVIAIALFEVAFTDVYANLFNSFAFYKNVGGISDSAASFKGQMLSLNGYRPEGIGRTILPVIFGSHRASSVFMEPIALGNFAVIILAWGLSKSLPEMRRGSIFILGAALLITLCDSRFGMLMALLLIIVRCMPLPIIDRLAPTVPLLILGILIALSMLFPSTGDNLHGRITTSGVALLNFDGALLMGLGAPLPPFGDMGYAYMLSRFGAPLAIALVAGIFLIPMADRRGLRFRQLIVLYIFANLAISGTSVFALKTAGVMWFLFGVLSRVRPEPVPRTHSMAANSTRRSEPLAVSASFGSNASRRSNDGLV